MILFRHLTLAAVLFCSGLGAGCAPTISPPPVATVPAPAAPSPAMLRAAWLKGYDAGFANGERLQSQADAEVTAQANVPPPHFKKPVPAAAAQPATAAPAPVASAPPQSVFIPIGPAEPLSTAQ